MLAGDCKQIDVPTLFGALDLNAGSKPPSIPTLQQLLEQRIQLPVQEHMIPKPSSPVPPNRSPSRSQSPNPTLRCLPGWPKALRAPPTETPGPRKVFGLFMLGTGVKGVSALNY